MGNTPVRPAGILGMDFTISDSWHPFFRPTTIRINWVLSGLDSVATTAGIFTVHFYFTNPAAAGSMTPVEILPATTINNVIQPQSGTITYTSAAYPAATSLSCWTIVVDTNTPSTTAKDFFYGGNIQFVP